MYGRAEQTTNENIIRRMRCTYWKLKLHTNIPNSFSAANMFARTRLSVTLYAHCLSCVCLPCEQHALGNGTLTRYYHHNYPCTCSAYLVKPFDIYFINGFPLSPRASSGFGQVSTLPSNSFHIFINL